MRISQNRSCQTIINGSKSRIEREVNRLARQTGAGDVSVTCFRSNGGRFSCIIGLTFGAFPTTEVQRMKKLMAKGKMR